MIVNANFHLRPLDTVNYGKLEVHVPFDDDYGSGNQNVEVRIGITGPLGQELKAYPVAPDFVYSTPGSFNTFVDIPLISGGSAGDWLQGNYIVRVNLTANPPVNGNFEDIVTFYFMPSVDSIVTDNLDVIFDCFARKFVATDNTDYSQVTFNDRQLTVQTPLVPGQPAPSPITSSEQQLQTDLLYEYANYTAGLSSNITTLTTVAPPTNSYGTWNWSILEEISAAITKEVVCDLDGCGILSCYGMFHDNVYNMAAIKGGLMGINEATRDLYTQVTGSVNLWLLYKMCQDTANMAIQYDKIKVLLKAAGCECATIVGPKVIEQSAGITYITGPSVYDLWLQQGNEGTIDDFFASLNPVTAWTDVPDVDFEQQNQQSLPKLQYRQTTRHLEFRGAFIRTVSHGTQPLPGTRVLLESTFAPATIEDGSVIPLYNEDAGNVGYFYQDTNDGTWKIREVLGFNATINTTISGMLPTVGSLITSGVTTTPWVLMPDAQLLGFESVGSDPMYYKVYPQYIAFRGSMTSFNPISGQTITKLIDVAFFTSLGIQVEQSGYGAVVNTGGTNNEYLGVVRMQSDGVYLYTASNYVGSLSQAIICWFPISEL